MRITALALVIVFGASSALAQTPGPLPPGKTAGIHQAQHSAQEAGLIVAAAALIGIGVALATSSNDATPTTNSTTSTVVAP